jgi:hypothetical protein
MSLDAKFAKHLKRAYAVDDTGRAGDTLPPGRGLDKVCKKDRGASRLRRFHPVKCPILAIGSFLNARRAEFNPLLQTPPLGTF